MNFTKYISSFIFIFSLATFSQNTENNEDKLALKSGTINNQFEYAIKRSNNYQDYKVIKKEWLYTLKSNTIDSLKAVHEDLLETQAIVNKQNKDIENLRIELINSKKKFDIINISKNSMSFFGLHMSKTSYDIIMWLIIIGLLFLLLYFIYRYKNSNVITKIIKKTLVDLEQEYEEHRRIALEREQKVRRELQDEIIKNNKAKGKK